MDWCLIWPWLFALLSGLAGWFLNDYFSRKKIQEKESLLNNKAHQYSLLSNRFDENKNSQQLIIDNLEQELSSLRVKNYDQKLQLDQLHDDIIEVYTKNQALSEVNVSQGISSGINDISEEADSDEESFDKTIKIQSEDVTPEISVTTELADDLKEEFESKKTITVNKALHAYDTDESVISEESEEMMTDLIGATRIEVESVKKRSKSKKELRKDIKQLKKRLKKRKSKYQNLKAKYLELLKSMKSKIDTINTLKKAKAPMNIIKEVPVEITKEIEIKELIDFKKLKKIIGKKLPTIKSKKLLKSSTKKGKPIIKKADKD